MERAEELKFRIKKIVIILVDELKGKKDEEIQAKLREDIQTLSKYDCSTAHLYLLILNLLSVIWNTFRESSRILHLNIVLS